MGVTALAGKYSGNGVTVGIIAVSFDSQGFDSLGTQFPSAADDVASGNLPGAQNPNGDTTPVVIVSEDNLKGDSNLGRVMAQVIYGIAPKAKLCFATPVRVAPADVFNSLIAGCNPQIIVIGDGYDEGDAFANGAGSAAIDAAVAAGITVIIAAGDQGPSVYNGTFSPISDAVARAGTFGNLKLDQVPAALTAGGFHDFATSGTPQLSFSGTLPPGGGFWGWLLEWDDRSDAVTADYKLLAFDADGTYLPNSSGTKHLDGAGPNSEVALQGEAGQFAISLPAPATAATALHLRIGNAFHNLFGDPAPIITGFTADSSGPSVRGSAATISAISVGSVSKGHLGAPESFSACGPFTNFFDPSGNRWTARDVRQKPDLLGVDGVDATFYPASVQQSPFNDTDQDSFPNVQGSGVSAAAVAGVAALTIEAAGGKVTPAQMMIWLQRSSSLLTGLASARKEPALAALPCQGTGLVNAVTATTLAAGGQASIGVSSPLFPPPAAPAAASGCGTAGSTSPLWILAAAAVVAFRRRRAI